MTALAPNQPKVKMIVAGNYGEYLAYCRENGYNPHKDKQVIYVRDANSFRGFRGYKVVLYGRHNLNPVYNLPDYYDELLERSNR